MDKDKVTVGLKIMDDLAPMAYKFIEKFGERQVIEALTWLASLIAAESDMPIEDFAFLARQCFQSNQIHRSPEEQVH